MTNFLIAVTAVMCAQAPLDAGADVAPLEADAGTIELDAGLVELDAGVVESPDAGVVVDVPDAGLTPPPDAQVAVEPGGYPALPKNFVGIRGRLTDAQTGEGLIEATVKVVVGGKKSAQTDVDGFYRLKLAPGTYELRAFYELYQGRRIQNVVVKPGEVTTLDIALESDARSVQEVVVEAKADKRNESALLQERKKAAVVSDAIGAQEISRTPDSSAGDAVKRVVSVTVVDGRYVYLRGLGGRYALTLLNGTLLPSPEPDEPSVPLDLFPTSLLNDLNVLKTYSPDLPASFGGGTLVIDTTTFPSQLDVRVRLGVSGDTQTTFRQRLGMPSSPPSESFGFSDGSRRLPDGFPNDGPLNRDTRQYAASLLRDEWTPTEVMALPNTSLSAQVGNTIKLGGEKKLGFLVAAQWGRKELTRRVHTSNPGQMEGAIVPNDSFDTVAGSVTGTSSVLGNVGLQLNRDNELNYLALFVANADQTAIVADGENLQLNSKQHATRISPSNRQLFFNQLKGFHRLNLLHDTEVNWQVNYSRVNRSEDDIRDFAQEDAGLGSIWSTQPGSGDRFFVGLTEQQAGGTVNVSIPIVTQLKLQLGGLYQFSGRDFSGRRFRYRNRGGLDLGVLQGPAEGIFAQPNVDADIIRFEENTRFEDAYVATQQVFGGYGLLEWRPKSWFRGMAGVRYEGSALDLQANSRFSVEPSPPDAVARRYNDVVPSANLTFSPRDSVNLRLAYAYTLARPTFRELGPFLFYDYIRRRNTTGNPDLVETRIHHADVRAEWFPGETEVLAASVFYKRFQNPIEKLVVGTDGQFLFANTPGADLVGTELEGRMGLGRVWNTLSDFRVGANLALVWSQISIGDGQQFQQTNTVRPLQGQSPWVVNGFVQWARSEWGTELGLFYNVNGPRITEVGTDQVQDFYEQPFHQLDFVVSQRLGAGFSLKASVINLLDQSRTIVSNPVEQYRYKPGVQFQLSLGWQLPRLTPSGPVTSTDAPSSSSSPTP